MIEFRYPILIEMNITLRLKIVYNWSIHRIVQIHSIQWRSKLGLCMVWKNDAYRRNTCLISIECSIYIFYQLLSYDFSLEYRSNWYIHVLTEEISSHSLENRIGTWSIRDLLIIEYRNECDWWRTLWSSPLLPLHHRDPISSDWMKWE